MTADFRFSPVLDEIIAERHTNPYIDFLLRELSNEAVSTGNIFQYGLERLPSVPNGPDMKLATFFLMLSEIEDVPRNVRSFALDLMIYCENAPDEPYSLRPGLIPKEYEKILPLLT